MTRQYFPFVNLKYDKKKIKNHFNYATIQYIKLNVTYKLTQ